MASTSDVFVWVWLPGEFEPVPAGRLRERAQGQFWFDYGRRYLEREDAVSLAPTLSLSTQTFAPTGSMGLPGALRDASPDAWGRRVVQYQVTGERGELADTGDLDERTYLLHSTSNRFGAIDFQESASVYVPRLTAPASLEDLLGAADTVEAGGELPLELERALLSGTAMGGARPKAVVEHDGRQYIAKFSASTDHFPVVGAEAASMFLAEKAGLRVASTRVESVLGRTVLLVERFDRTAAGGRILASSALTLTGLDELQARSGSYVDLLDALRQWGAPAGTAEELFARVAFNMAISNSDDHLRNHAALWDGKTAMLSPAYDLSPMSRSGETASQAIAYGRAGQKRNNFGDLLAVRHLYDLTAAEADGVIGRIEDAIRSHWEDAADYGQLTVAERRLLWGRQFLNPGTLYGSRGR
ncbi:MULTISPECIES: type II toxin-antitoxin system HipA family toxin [Microbacterium]|uniref:type II toxin-antitoxin system HipA family toxin n=1 Tax=Microbacterium TaxID=33882 RepID=UPI00277ED27F|nr:MULTISPECIES: HipA domain-containing protein [Microbacterium]MDQ1075134.1 serine/threonine-protein kinase HipA [Microbacterium sp. SORGH_AS_0969]MDQ1115365.1 serine/threonine-protein kinase HipA [Microbacterium testaceum]